MPWSVRAGNLELLGRKTVTPPWTEVNTQCSRELGPRHPINGGLSYFSLGSRTTFHLPTPDPESAYSAFAFRCVCSAIIRPPVLCPVFPSSALPAIEIGPARMTGSFSRNSLSRG
jgi:hypothetical protein